MYKQSYVLVTPARNEEDYIEKTILSIVSQTVLPAKWVIVSDGSIDRTDSIVTRYAQKYNFISLIRIPGHRRSNFASKVNAFHTGYNELRSTKYDLIGNLDADVSFDRYYYERILTKFNENVKLGMAGGIIFELINGQFYPQNISMNSVAGAVQLFRRQCYEDIGGYLPLEYGGIDAAAEVMARMKKWEVQTFPDIKVYHPRRVGVANRSILRARFIEGRRFYLLGYHPLFYMLRCLCRAKEKPYFFGSVARLYGYLLCCIKRRKRPVSVDFINYLKMEQLKRIRALFDA